MRTLIACFLLVASVASGQDQPVSAEEIGRESARAEQARALFERGLSAAESGAHADALVHFERSFALVPRASTAFNVAVQHARLGRPTAALRALDALDPLQPTELDRRDADMLRVRLRDALSTLVVRMPAHATLWVDGGPIAGDGAERTLVLDPGTHRLEARVEGYLPARREVTLLEGVTAEERFELVATTPRGVARADAARPEPAPPRARRIALATTAAVVVLGAVITVLALALRPPALPSDGVME
ncbi:MAG: hypothetical protein R3B99_26290 [Polyangiales bacterium]